MATSHLVHAGILTALVTLTLAGTSSAQSLDPVTSTAPLAVQARVVSTRAAWDRTANVIVTYVALDVIQQLRGTPLPARVVLKQLGGEVEGLGLWIADQATFRAGEDTLLYLSAAADSTLHTAGLARGKLAVTTEALSAAARPAFGQGGTASTATVVAIPPEYEALSRQAGPLFAFLNTGGDPARWHEVDGNAPVFVDSGTIPGTWGHATAANVTAAVNLWRGSGMDLDLQVGGAYSGQCAASFTGNGRIAISFNDPCGTVSDWVVGGGYYTPGDLRTVNGTQFQKFIQGFLVLDNTGVQATATGCFQDAVAHGLGHALGLGHSSDGNAMMAPNPRSGCTSVAGTLSNDDVAGINAIYQGIGTGPTPPDPPTNFSGSVVLTNLTLSWTPASTGGTAQRYVVEAGTAPGVYNIGSATFPANPTSTTIGAVPPGTYYLRIRAQNAVGTSAPSPEIQVTVGACAPPAPPGTLSGSASDTLVNLRWSAPATGVTQGYLLSAGSAPTLSNLGVQSYPASVTSLAGSVPYGNYYVRVQATNVCGVSAPSNEILVAVTPCTVAPQAPTGLAVTKNGTFLTFTWTAPTGTPPSSYVFAVGSAPGSSNLVVSSTGTTSTTLAGNAPPGAYYVRVLAQNACGQSVASNEVFVSVP